VPHVWLKVAVGGSFYFENHGTLNAPKQPVLNLKWMFGQTTKCSFWFSSAPIQKRNTKLITLLFSAL